MTGTVYILVLDSTEHRPERKVISYRGRTVTCNVLLQAVLDLVPIELLVVAVPETLGIDTVKKARELLKNILREEKTQKLLDETWVEVLSIKGKSIAYKTLSFMTSLRKILSKYENTERIIIDQSLLESESLRISVTESIRLSTNLELFNNIEIRMLLLDRIRRGTFKVIEQELEKTENRLNTIVKVLKLTENAPEIEPSDKHRVRLLLGKLQVALEKARLGLAFELMNELADLAPVYYRALREVRDPVLKEILNLLPVEEYIAERSNVIELAERVVRLMIDLDQVGPAVLFIKNFAHVYVYAHCCYYGILEVEECNVKSAEKFLEEINLLDAINNVSFRKIKSAVSTILKSGLTTGLCTEITVRNPENIAQVTCPGTLNRSDLEEAILDALKDLRNFDPYSLCQHYLRKDRSREGNSGGAAGI